MNKNLTPFVLAVMLIEFAMPAAAVQSRSVRAHQGDTSLVIRRVWKGEYPSFEMLAISPDGQLWSGVDWRTGNLFVADYDTDETRPVTSTGSWTGGSMEWAESSVFSPDGQEIAYVWWSDQAGGYGVRIVGVDESDPRVVLPHSEANAGIFVEDWSADGTRLLIKVLGSDQVWRLMLLSTTDSTIQLVKVFGERPPQVAVFSPDARYLAYDVQPDDESRDHDIYTITVDGEQERELVGTTGDDRLLGWMPSGDKILFYSDRELTRGIWRVPVDDGGPAAPPELLRADIWQLLPIGFSGGKYFYAVITEALQVHTASLDIEAGRVVTTSTPVADPSRGTSRTGVWSPDGSQLAYLWREHGDPTWQLAIRSLGGGDVRVAQLPFSDVTRLEWVPDSRTVMVFGTHRRRRGLFQFDLGSGQAAPVLTGSDVPGELRLHASFSPDGRTLYFAREVPSGSDDWRLVARDFVHGVEREIVGLERSSQLASGGDLHTAVSPDGRTLAIALQDPETRTFRISVLPTSGGELQEVHQTANAFRGSGVFCWTPDGRNLLFRGVDDEGNMDLLVIPRAGGAVRRITGVPGFWGFSLHPDGRRFTFDHGGNTTGEIWVIENLR